MALVAKRNDNSSTSTARRDTMLPPALNSFPDAFGLIRALDAIGSSVPASGLIEFPPIDISERSGKYVVEAATPSFRQGDITVEVTGNELTISGKHEEEEANELRRYSEIRRSSFSRTLVLPRDVDQDKTKATFENGMLTITLEPTKPSGATKIAIGAK